MPCLAPTPAGSPGASRQRIPTEHLQRLGITLPQGMRKVVELRNPQGHRYFGCGRAGGGTYGQWTYLVDEAGKELGAKIFRLNGDKGSDAESAERAAATRLKTNLSIDKEIRNIFKHSRSLEVLDDFEVKDKRYVVMTAKPGCLANVVAGVSDLRKRRAAIRYAAAAVARHLAEMDARGSMHGDVKETNVLVDGKGGVELCDFGSVRDLVPGDPDAPVIKDTVGTYSPPERPYGRSGDVWALGASIASLSHGNAGGTNIFCWKEFYEPDASFRAWRQKLVRHGGRLDLSAMPGGSTWSERFRDFAASDPVACERRIRSLPDRHGRYRDWHKQVLGMDGVVRLDRVLLDGTYTQWLSELLRDRALFTFVVAELGNPRVEQRMEVGYVASAIESIMAPGEARVGKKALASAAKKQPSVAIFKTLQTYRKKTQKAEKARARAASHGAFNPLTWVRRAAAR